MNKIRLLIIVAVGVLCFTVWIQQKRITAITQERDRHSMNSDAMLSDLKQWQIDSTTMATDVKSLRFTVDEMERYRAEDVTKIREMGLEIENLEATAKHRLEVDIPISVPIIDSVILRDLEPIRIKAVTMNNPYIAINATIENDMLVGSIKLPVTIQQAVWIEYKRHWLFWKRPIAVHQTITTDNPYVKVSYSEYIKVTK